jgi:hypothetical protein
MSAKGRIAAPFRNALKTGAARWPRVRRAVTAVSKEFDQALRDDVYEDEYFASYTRESTHADAGAYLIWRFFPVRRTLDVGCALGYFVEAQRELGIEAFGVDISQDALDRVTPGARGHVQYGNLLYTLPLADRQVELVSAYETLEHLPPEVVPKALAELRRVTSAYLIATIPSFGPNANGPGGWFDVKVRPERLDYYRSLGDAYEGPVPFEDLYRDEHGAPIEGHLTIASFGWWTKQFEAAGFVRCADVERRIHPHLARFGLTKYWNLYVLRVPDAPEPTIDMQDASAIADLEAKWGMGTTPPDPEDLARVEEALR